MDLALSNLIVGSGQSDDIEGSNQIFIAREKQVAAFAAILEKWHDTLSHPTLSHNTTKTQLDAPPTAERKIAGLVVIIYGRSGYGKSTLLRHFVQQAHEYRAGAFKTGQVINWYDDLSERERHLLSPVSGSTGDNAKGLEPQAYYELLRKRLSFSLGKKPGDFKEYNSAVAAITKANQKGDAALAAFLKNEQKYAGFANLGGAVIKQALARVSLNMLPQPLLDKTHEVGAKTIHLSAEKVAGLRSELHDKLGATKLGDYLEPQVRLGRGLGRDLANWAKSRPLLLSLDTYEVADEADELLRIVMGTAGQQVGWLLAGRDNLWDNSTNRRRKMGESGYKQIVRTERSLAIDLDNPAEGRFTTADISEYFNQLCELNPGLAPISDKTDLERVEKLTQGVPLAVAIAGGLYREKGNLEILLGPAAAIVTLPNSGGTNQAKADAEVAHQEIVASMVERYLLHTDTTPQDRLKLYGLALLRRAKTPADLQSALGIDSGNNSDPKQTEPEQVSTADELRRLHRLYSFVFQGVTPSLHEEVRLFLRKWLVTQRKLDNTITEINRQLAQRHLEDLQALESRRQYATLKERFEDEEWVELYLDLAEQKMWLDPNEGVISYVLPFAVAASIYRRETVYTILSLSQPLYAELVEPALNYWRWLSKSLRYLVILRLVQDNVEAYYKLIDLAKADRVRFSPELNINNSYQQELEGLLWWRLAEAIPSNDITPKLTCLEEAISRLPDNEELKNNFFFNVGIWVNSLLDKGQYNECLDLLQRIKNLNLNEPFYHSEEEGDAYLGLGNYPAAIRAYTESIDQSPYEFEVVDEGKRQLLESLAITSAQVRPEIEKYQTFVSDTGEIEEDEYHFYARTLTGMMIQMDDIMKLVLEEIAKSFEDFGGIYYKRGLAYLWTGNNEAARSDFQSERSLTPQALGSDLLVEWLSLPKQAPDKTKRLELAEELEQLADQTPLHPVSPMCRGIAFGLDGHLQEGLALFEDQLTDSFKWWGKHFWKGLLLAYLGRSQQALEELERAKALKIPPALLFPLGWLEQDRPQLYREQILPWWRLAQNH